MLSTSCALLLIEIELTLLLLLSEGVSSLPGTLLGKFLESGILVGNQTFKGTLFSRPVHTAVKVHQGRGRGGALLQLPRSPRETFKAPFKKDVGCLCIASFPLLYAPSTSGLPHSCQNADYVSVGRPLSLLSSQPDSLSRLSGIVPTRKRPIPPFPCLPPFFAQPCCAESFSNQFLLAGSPGI